VSSCVNIVLDIVFIAAFGMGVGGAALATIISIACNVAIHFIGVLRTGIKRCPADLHTCLGDGRELMRLGGSMALRNLIISFGGTIGQYVVNGFGTVFVAGIAAPWKLYSLMEVVANGYDGANATFVAQNTGAGLLDRVKEGVAYTRRVLIVASVAIAVVMIVFGRVFLGIFVTGADAAAVIDIGKVQLNIMVIALPALYMLFLYRSALQGLGRAVPPLVSGFIELALKGGCMLALPFFMGEWGVYIAQVAGWLGAGGYLYLMYRRYMIDAMAQRQRN
jgi:Na+-driven multidrug efflux pump